MMAGYSGTPLARKLGIKAGQRVLTLGAPKDFAASLEPLPVDVKLLTRARNKVNIVIVFASRVAELYERFERALALIPPDGALWVAWPKKTSGVRTQLDFNLVQRHGLNAGLVDNKVCAISEVYSGLRFVYRLADR